MKVLYFDCFSGISGDMTIGAFIDAGMDHEKLVSELSKLGLNGYSLKCEKVNKNGLSATKFNVMDENGAVFGHAPIFAHCHKRHEHHHEPHGHPPAHNEGHDHPHPHEGGPHLHGEGCGHHHHECQFPELHHDHYEHHVPDHPHHHEVDGTIHEHFHPGGDHPHDHSYDHGHDHHHGRHDHPPPPGRPPAHRENHGHPPRPPHVPGTGCGHHSGPHGDHGHSHDHDHGHEGEEHRGLKEIRKMILDSKLSARVKELSLSIFQNIAEAESKMHGISIDKIYFHEVGAIDSIIDIVGTAICIDHMGIEECFVSKVPISFGYLNFSHGKWPNPAPAALELLRDFTLYKLDIDRELVTPTGAAILRTLCKKPGVMPDFAIGRIGYGAGYHTFEHPNVLRIMIGEVRDAAISSETARPAFVLSGIASQIGSSSDEVDDVTANIDDMRPEFFEPLIERLMSAGALDVAVAPVMMKKGRPSNRLSVMCPPAKTAAVCSEIFKQSSTIGMRVQRTGRLILDRKASTLSTPEGEVRFKTTFLAGERLHTKPEYEDLRKYAEKRGISMESASRELSALFERENK